MHHPSRNSINPNRQFKSTNELDRSLSRRDFLKSSATVASVTIASAPLFLHATDKSGSKLPTVGVDGHRYEVQHHCLVKPDHLPWGDTHGVCVDAEGLIYVKHRLTTNEWSDAILVFDAKGKLVRSFGKEFHGGGHGIDVRSESGQQFLYVCDLKGHIAKLTLTGEVVWKQRAPELDVYAKAWTVPDGKLGRARGFTPTNIAFAPNGDFYVADGYGSHYIIHYNQQGEVLNHWGGKGASPGKMSTPHGIWWDDRGDTPLLCVADRANKRLQYFTPDGKHHSFVSGMLFPADVDIQGDIMVVPDLFARVTLLDKDNHVIAHLGDDEGWRMKVLEGGNKLRHHPEKFEDGKFVHPHDACFDSNGDIYVVEWVPTGRVSRLRKVS